MSDDPTQPNEAEETVQGAVESEAPSSPPPWGDDFTPERAWKTILTQRDREKELESDAKAWKRLQDDEDARNEFVKQHYEFAEDEEDGEAPDPYDDDDDPIAARLAAIEQIEEQRAAREEAQNFQTQWSGWEDYVKGLVPEGSRELTAWELKALKMDSADQKGWPVQPDKASKVVAAFLKEREEYDTTIVEKYRQSKRVPNTSPQPGKAGEAQFDRKAATPQQRREERQARLAALNTAPEQ